MVERIWHFHCPACSVGDFELGCLAADEELVCELCLEEGSVVRLERWMDGPSDPVAETDRQMADAATGELLTAVEAAPVTLCRLLIRSSA